MQQEISELREEVQFLRNEVQKSYCTLEPDIDTDIEVYNSKCNNDYIEEYNNINSLHSNASSVLLESVYEIKEKKKNIKRKKERNTAGQGSVGSDGISIFSSSKDNELQGEQGTLHRECNSDKDDFLNILYTSMEQDNLQGQRKVDRDTTPKKSYEEIIHILTNRVRKGQPFDEKGMRDYIYEHFIRKGSVTQSQLESDIKGLYEIKDSQTCSNGNSLHPMDSDSGEIEISARPASLGDDNLSDDNLLHPEEKSSQNANQTPNPAIAVARETVNGILKQLDDYYTDGATVLEYEPLKYKVEMSHPVSWHDMVRVACDYLQGRGLSYSNLCIEAVDDPRYSRTFNIYDNI